MQASVRVLVSDFCQLGRPAQLPGHAVRPAWGGQWAVLARPEPAELFQPLQQRSVLVASSPTAASCVMCAGLKEQHFDMVKLHFRDSLEEMGVGQASTSGLRGHLSSSCWHGRQRAVPAAPPGAGSHTPTRATSWHPLGVPACLPALPHRPTAPAGGQLLSPAEGVAIVAPCQPPPSPGRPCAAEAGCKGPGSRGEHPTGHLPPGGCCQHARRAAPAAVAAATHR